MSEVGSVRDSAIGSSRVNYLREKLKEFEKINKKYETPNQKISQETVEKMKNYKYFLEQSESEIEPSNLVLNEDRESPLNKWKTVETKKFKNFD